MAWSSPMHMLPIPSACQVALRSWPVDTPFGSKKASKVGHGDLSGSSFPRPNILWGACLSRVDTEQAMWESGIWVLEWLPKTEKCRGLKIPISPNLYKLAPRITVLTNAFFYPVRWICFPTHTSGERSGRVAWRLKRVGVHSIGLGRQRRIFWILKYSPRSVMKRENLFHPVRKKRIHSFFLSD